MAVCDITLWPERVLTQRTQEVATIDDATRKIVADMFDTMYHAHGIGLAANQIAVPLRIVVIDLDPQQQRKSKPKVDDELKLWKFVEPVALINPVITQRIGSITWEEGCLSLPGINATVKRANEVVVTGLNARGEKIIVEAAGLFAVCLQHEIDHLDGKVFVDYLSKIKRDIIRRKMARLRQEHATRQSVETADLAL